MMRALRSWLCSVALVALAAEGRAAEIVLEHSAVDKLIAQTLFNHGGHHDITGGACRSFLEAPSVELKDGRLWIRSHLWALVGVEVGGKCVGTNLAAWTVVSGRPVPAGGKVRLEGIRVESVDDPNLRLLLDAGLVQALPNSLELDVRKAVEGMLQNGVEQFETAVDTLAIEAVTVGNDRLSIRFNFRLVAR